MKRKGHNEVVLRSALRALLSDIEGMYEGDVDLTNRGEPEEYFGPFSEGKLDGAEISGISVSWPNLAISMRNAQKALRDIEPDS